MKALPGGQHDLHGSAPDNHHTCLLLIDVISDFEFPRGDELFERARTIAPRIARLKQTAREVGIPCIYANDNFGRWRSSRVEILEMATRDGARGKSFVELLLPGREDYFVLKPKHSAFYQTPLELLLKHLGTERLVLCGVSTNSCILFTANDAYMRDLQLVIPRDCVAACNSREHDFALDQMKTMLKADTRESSAIDRDFLLNQATVGS
jgi:nicotinamidase-related amidase